MQNTIDFYNQQVKDYKAQKGEKSVEEFIDNNPQMEIMLGFIILIGMP